MKNLAGYLRIDMRRAFISPVFPLAIVGIALLLYIGAEPEIRRSLMAGYPQYVDHLYDMTKNQGFSQAAYILGALPFGASFCLDWNHQYVRALLIRGNIVRYAVSKAAVCFFSGFSVIALGQVVFIVILRFFFPLVNPSAEGLESISQMSHGDMLLHEGHYILYFVLPIVALALGAAFYSLVALLVSTKTQNTFVVLTSPIIVSTMIQLLVNILNLTVDVPLWANPVYVLGGQQNLMPALWSSVCYQTGVICVLSGIMGCIIVQHMRKKVAHG